VFWQCKEKAKNEENIRLVTFHGSNVGRFLDTSIAFSSLDSLGYVSLLTHNGDWISTDKFLFSITSDLPDTLRVHELDSLMYINGNLTAISITKNSSQTSFLNQFTAEEISRVRTIQFKEPIGDSIKPFLKKISLQNPKVDIVFFPELDSVNLLNRDLLWLSEYFQPRSLFFQNETDSISLSNLKNFTSLETLFLTLPIKGDGYFPHLPQLREIILLNDDSTFIGSGFFRQNPDIESLTIINNSKGKIDLASINKLKNLQNLYIETDSIILNDLYKHHPNLKMLHIGLYNEGGSISDIFKKNKLKRLSLYPFIDPFMGQNLKVLQDSFPELESLEFENNDSLFNYRDIKDFKKLKYLTVFGKVGLDSTLYNFNQLRYLSLSDDFLKDSLNVIKLKKTLPNTVITPNSGACLGSGWLLLIIPIAGLWFYFLKPKMDRVND